MSRLNAVAVVQTVVPDYRVAFFNELSKAKDAKFEIYAGSEYFTEAIRSASLTPAAHSSQNVFFRNRSLLWQKGVMGSAIAASACILEFNPRVLSSWAILMTRRLLNRPTLLWGHVAPRSQSHHKTTLMLRWFMLKCAGNLITYTAREQAAVAARYPRLKTTAAPNALYPYEPVELGDEDRTDICYVGRLIESKRPHLLVDAFIEAVPHLSPNARLHIVGQGPERERITKTIQEARLEKRIALYGSVNEYEDLQALYSKCFLSVSPGYAGLSVTQSLWFGVPVLVAKDEMHAPELAEFGPEGIYWFEKSSTKDLAQHLADLADSSKSDAPMRLRLANDCRSRFNTGLMVSSFRDATIKAESNSRETVGTPSILA